MTKTEGNFKILSIDGGGIKGLYSAMVLSAIEEAYGKGRRLADYFDMICGTSTGGLIALGLSRRIPAQDLVQFYIDEGGAIFGSDNKLGNAIRAFKQTMFGGKYSDKVLREALTRVLGADTQMSDAQTLLCIPSFNLMKGIPRVFKFPHQEGHIHKEKYGRMVDVALATSAAPTYFPIAEIDNVYYVDGGVWANNPTLCGVMEALEYFVGPDKQLLGVNADKTFTTYSVLSISSVAEPGAWSTRGTSDKPKKRNRSFLGWQDKLFMTSMNGQNHFADNFARKLIDFTKAKGSYYRVECPPLSADQYRAVGMDRASKTSLNQLKVFGKDIGNDLRTRKREFIAPFFSTPKLYSTTLDES